MHRNIKPETRDVFFAEYPDFTTGLASGKVKDRNKDKPKPIKIRSAVYTEMKELWEKINHRYLLLYDTELNDNLENVILTLFEKPGVFTDVIMRSEREVVKSTGAEMNILRETGVQYTVTRTIPYGVFLKEYLQQRISYKSASFRSVCIFKKHGDILRNILTIILLLASVLKL